jgi:phage shock protein PspC (stress-responsive transcriptional regulator)
MSSTAPEADSSTDHGTRPDGTAVTGETPLTGTDIRRGRGQLYRPADDRMLAGVASGAARFLAIDVMLVRIALVVLCFAGGLGLPVYLASWLLIPDEGAEQSIAADFIHSIQGGRD